MLLLTSVVLLLGRWYSSRKESVFAVGTRINIDHSSNLLVAGESPYGMARNDIWTHECRSVYHPIVGVIRQIGFTLSVLPQRWRYAGLHKVNIVLGQ
jgi:hypothetical protein